MILLASFWKAMSDTTRINNSKQIHKEISVTINLDSINEAKRTAEMLRELHKKNTTSLKDFDLTMCKGWIISLAQIIEGKR